MKAGRWILWMAFSLALAANCSGQRAENWRVYKASDGLPETYVSSIGTGQRGHIWLRHPGLEWIGRLDGYEIESVPAPDASDSRIYESASGQLWTFSGGILMQYRKDGGWIKYSAPEITAAFQRNHLSPVYPIPLYPLKQNHVLLLFPDALLECSIDNPDRVQTTVFHAANSNGLQAFTGMTASFDGALWIAGRNGLIKSSVLARNLKPDSDWQEFLFDSQVKIRRLRQPVEDNAGGIVALAESADEGQQLLAHFDGRQWTFQPLARRVNQAWRETDQSYWAISANALMQLKTGGKDFSPYTEISPHHYFDFAVETNGVFWLATSEGLYRYAPLAWRAPQGLQSENFSVSSITEDAVGNLWAASAKSLHLFRENQWQSFNLPVELVAKGSQPHRVFALTNGLIVVSADDHAFGFNLQTHRFSAINLNPAVQQKAIGLLNDGTLLVQTRASENSSTLECFNGLAFQPISFPQPDQAATNDFQFSVVAQNGTLWLGHKNGVLALRRDKWEAFDLSPFDAFGPGTEMVEVADGKFWFGLENKIISLEGKSFATVRGGFDTINGLVKSRDGSVWVATDNGVQRFYRGTWVGNGTEEGLPASAVSEIYEDRQSQLWAGTARGLAQYHPDADRDPPHTYVQNLPSGNNNLPEGATANISFSGRDKWKYTPEESLLYSYRLDGQDWSPYQEQRGVTLIDLAAGTHSFYVRSMDRNWNVDPQPALLQFKITVPWYRESRLIATSAAGTAIALFFAGLAFNRHRRLVRSYAEVEAQVAIRTRQLKIANQELFHSQKMNALGTLAAGIAHDFNNILSIIKGSAQIIEDNLDNEGKIRTRTDRIKTVVEQGAGIVKAMLGFSRGSDRNIVMCDVNAIVQETIVLLGDRFLREVEVQFEPSKTRLPEVPASKDFLQQMLLNFIFNAAEATIGRQKVILRISRASQLPASYSLTPAKSDGYIFVSVQDFGSGIAPDIMHRIFEPFFTTKSLSARRGTGLGLSMVYELARQMECGLSVESVLGQGSTFTVIIPIRDLPVESLAKKS